MSGPERDQQAIQSVSGTKLASYSAADTARAGVSLAPPASGVGWLDDRAQPAAAPVPEGVARELALVQPEVLRAVLGASLRPESVRLTALRWLLTVLDQDLAVLRGAGYGLVSGRSDAATPFTEMRKEIAETLNRAERWHREHPAGQSLGQWNEETGTELAGTGRKRWEQGGFANGAVSALAYAGAAGVATLDAAEQLLTFGFHEAATAVAEAYERGDISWDDGERIVHSAAWRALLVAAVSAATGFVGGRVAGAAAVRLGLQEGTVVFGRLTGAAAGATGGVGALTTQVVFNELNVEGFDNAVARAIWLRGAPSGQEWVFTITLGAVLGGAIGGAATLRELRKMIGRTVQTDFGPVRIRAVTDEGHLVVVPVEPAPARTGAPRASAASQMVIDVSPTTESAPTRAAASSDVAAESSTRRALPEPRDVTLVEPGPRARWLQTTEPELHASIPPPAREVSVSVGPPVSTEADALRLYDAVIAETQGRLEVGIWQMRDGRYVVRLGQAMSVQGPADALARLHYHPNLPGLPLWRMPSPNDVDGMSLAALRSGAPITEAVESPLPDGRLARTRFTLHPGGRVEIDGVSAEGLPLREVFDTPGDYARFYLQQKVAIDPSVEPETYAQLRDSLDRLYGGQATTPDEARGMAGGRAPKRNAQPEASQASGKGSGGGRSTRATITSSETAQPGGKVIIKSEGRVGDAPAARPGLEKKYPLGTAAGLPGYVRFHVEGIKAIGEELNVVYAPERFNISETALIENQIRVWQAEVKATGGDLFFDFTAKCRLQGEVEGVQVKVLEEITWKIERRLPGTDTFETVFEHVGKP